MTIVEIPIPNSDCVIMWDGPETTIDEILPLLETRELVNVACPWDEKSNMQAAIPGTHVDALVHMITNK